MRSARELAEFITDGPEHALEVNFLESSGFAQEGKEHVPAPMRTRHWVYKSAGPKKLPLDAVENMDLRSLHALHLWGWELQVTTSAEPISEAR